MESYSKNLLQQLAAYKKRDLPGLADGDYVYRGEVRQYAHILPTQEYRENILPVIRESFWTWFGSCRPPITRHKFFHHLNSSQAMCFNLFFPFCTEESVDKRLLEALELRSDLGYRPTFEKVIDPKENTNFDLYLEGSNGERVFFELKLSENAFGSCANDEEHREKLELCYRPYLKNIVAEEWLEPSTFFKHYQILRNIFYLCRFENSSLIFLFPRANECLRGVEHVIHRIGSQSLCGRIRVLYLEDVVKKIIETTANDPRPQLHLKQFSQKYIV